MSTITAILIGAGARGTGYASYAKKYPEDIKFIAVAEPDIERRKSFAKEHNITSDNCFTDWREILEKEKMADVAFICTQDQMHFEPAVIALKKKYHLILEKPMSFIPEECIQLGELAKKENRIFAICHVLRYTAFFQKIKELLNSDAIGKIMTIDHRENVGYYHQAHSFVRGNWRNSKESTPMILQKSCHDMDILLYLTGARCKSVSSYGELSHFKKENAPEGATLRCYDGCSARENCIYDCEKIYLEKGKWMRKTISVDQSDEAVREALKTGPYGRCVYHCDNDVVDHQVVNMEFYNEITAVFTMTAFSHFIGREIKIHGTKGTLTASEETQLIEVRIFGSDEVKSYRIPPQEGGHGGGDNGFMDSLVSAIKEGTPMDSAADISVESHMMSFAAEKSRLERKMIEMDEYRSSFKIWDVKNDKI